mmetsp:Transcript_42108/g.51096  ORF Transcript_42108/g.51096 Transcript_42108/m.51096 type:complete len:236 (+) Transcript_42108:143-850(+)|eukprot:CAMPEP_0197858556 /NCGR_PEP_ID=MMETSP1438-20131217/32428_1 /TAXON_ID=1461541 /ORGANISM="Pterosperma sp., Strain CCMP1384" /LENGTH=235 /DNA_ID=CAMNT_0043474755 /DNA_START=143 /DNA_END=853 /DNA_ORIENTATION=-
MITARVAADVLHQLSQASTLPRAQSERRRAFLTRYSHKHSKVFSEAERQERPSQGHSIRCQNQQQRVLLRRTVLDHSLKTVAGLAVLGDTDAVVAQEQEPSDPFAGSYVKPSLSVAEYMARVEAVRGEALGHVEDLIDKGKYGLLNTDLVLSPFDDIRQALFYTPWVLLKYDEAAGIQAQLAYLRFLDKLKDLDRVSYSASRYEAEPEEVDASFTALVNALDDFIAAIPSWAYSY